ncbi:MAG: hypothetical protein OXT65_07520 [Alphaproteobacteria bacterium]|nr:hypothetical protein [Alphaproteobacteria bacterium]
MPSYHGVERDEIVQSIKESLELLEKHSPGPYTQAYIDDVHKTTPLSEIASAQTDKELVGAVNGSKTSYLFLRLSEVLLVHAAKNTDGTAADTYHRLTAWGATDGATAMNYTPLDKEADLWLLKTHARSIADNPPAKTKNDAELDLDAQKDLMTVARAFKFSTANGNSVAADVFEKKNLNERYLLLNAARALSPLKPDAKALSASPPIQGYGLECDIKQDKEDLRALRDKVEEALGPYWGLGEVGSTGIGLITHNEDPKKDKLGIVFNASARAAEAVANAFPNERVLNSDGNRLQPKGKPPAPPAA